MKKTRIRSRTRAKKAGATSRRRPLGLAAGEKANGSAAKAIGRRLRMLRIERKLSQGDVESRSGLLRCYISRVEGGHTVPNLITLEKFAAALQVPLHLLFFQGKGTPARPARVLREPKTAEWDAPLAKKLRRLVGKMDDRGRDTLFGIVRKLAVMEE